MFAVSNKVGPSEALRSSGRAENSTRSTGIASRPTPSKYDEDVIHLPKRIKLVMSEELEVVHLPKKVKLVMSEEPELRAIESSPWRGRRKRKREDDDEEYVLNEQDVNEIVRSPLESMEDEPESDAMNVDAENNLERQHFADEGKPSMLERRMEKNSTDASERSRKKISRIFDVRCALRKLVELTLQGHLTDSEDELVASRDPIPNPNLLPPETELSGSFQRAQLALGDYNAAIAKQFPPMSQWLSLVGGVIETPDDNSQVTSSPQ